eukprot:TRINITY_DN12556_c0_g2_i1.p1 TRINITY_DN12556_c0_g2~~TRINITY_DN12556_c0_g2_i1.p1  ORF type:complete len:541 (-),score=141.52 TRINITY_DN12556_c0_g2_i1:68-1612(-)
MAEGSTLRIRSATYFYSASSLSDAVTGMKHAASSLGPIQKGLKDAGYEVQTVRVATNSFEEYLSGSVQSVVEGLQEIEAAAGEAVTFISAGTVEQRLDVMEAALTGEATKKTFFAAPIHLNAKGLPDLAAAKQVAESVCRLGKAAPAKTSEVPAVFRMTVTANLDAGAPYFPGGYWKKGQAPALGVALEDSGLLVQAFEGADSLEVAQDRLYKVFADALQPLEHTVKQLADAAGIDYAGIDCSIASSAKDSESLVKAYESLGLGRFGGAGTLSISALITAVMKKLPVERCGYSGLMLPLTEDAGLAQRGNEGRLSVQQLLFYSAVCGTGIDTVPIEGSTPPERLAMVYMDMASQAFRLRKPLSARLWPVCGKQAGEMTEVDNPFFVNTKVLAVDPADRGAVDSPAVSAMQVAGLGGEVTILSDSPEALVIRLCPNTAGLALNLRNCGARQWPEGVHLRPLQPLPTAGQEKVQVLPAHAGESVSLALWLEGSPRNCRFRLCAEGREFGPVIIVVE